jgi:hypothetical protein
VSDFSQQQSERLYQLLADETKLLENLRKAAKEQSIHLAEDKMDDFDKSFSVGQEIIGEIDRLHQETNLLMQSYVSFSNSGNGRKVDKIEESIKAFKSIIAECAELNEINMVSAKEKMEEYSQQITKSSQSRKSIGVYAQSVTNNPEFFDKKT